MSNTKALMLVVMAAALYLETCAAPHLLLPQPRPHRVPWGSNPTFLALHRENVLTILPRNNEDVYLVLSTKSNAGEEKSSLSSSNINVYYITNTVGEVKSDLQSGDDGMKSNITVVKSVRLPTLGDVIEIIPFLPIEINVPNVIAYMTSFLNWIMNWRPQDQSNPRIYFMLKNPHGYDIYPFITKPTLPKFPYDNHPSYGILKDQLVLPVYGTSTV